jgi:hypothetical protein
VWFGGPSPKYDEHIKWVFPILDCAKRGLLKKKKGFVV